MIGHDATSAVAERVIMCFVCIRGGGLCKDQPLEKKVRSRQQRILGIVLELDAISSYHHIH